MMKLSIENLRKILQSISNTNEVEMDCKECYEELDCFVETELAGRNAAEAMPLVEDHLKRCSCCFEEYQALLDAIRATSSSNPPPFKTTD
jgi:hypothetical protein